MSTPLSETLAKLEAEATPGPWEWYGVGSGEHDESRYPEPSGLMLGHATEWAPCRLFCFGWSDGDDLVRGERGKPGHEHRKVEYSVLWLEDRDDMSPANRALIAALRNHTAEIVAALRLAEACAEYHDTDKRVDRRAEALVAYRAARDGTRPA